MTRLLLTFLLLINACKNGKGGFSGSSSSKEGEKTETQAFTVAGPSNVILDVVWAIDNSQSMVEEVTQVNNNMEKFITSLATIPAQAKAGIISCATDANAPGCIKYALTDKLKWIPNEPNGTNILAVLASEVCDEKDTQFKVYDKVPSVDSLEQRDGSTKDGKSGYTELARGTVCNVPFDTKVTDAEGTIYYIAEWMTYGAGFFPKQLFRPQSKKIFIVATDDVPRGFRGAEFKKAMDGKFGAGNYRFFAFAGKSASSCGIVKKGQDYDSLASGTGGEVFDLCAADWAPYFDKLLAGIKNSVLPSYPIPAAPGEQIIIKSVTANGVLLTSAQYTFANGVLILADSVVAPAGSQVVVTYSRKPL
jgi:hypothetical protein